MEKKYNYSNSWREKYLSGKPLRIGNNIQFLFDDYIVEDKYAVRREIEQPVKHPHNPLLVPERPWEGVITVNGQVQVLYDQEERIFSEQSKTKSPWWACPRF